MTNYQKFVCPVICEMLRDRQIHAPRSGHRNQAAISSERQKQTQSCSYEEPGHRSELTCFPSACLLGFWRASPCVEPHNKPISQRWKLRWGQKNPAWSLEQPQGLSWAVPLCTLSGSVLPDSLRPHGHGHVHGHQAPLSLGWVFHKRSSCRLAVALVGLPGQQH